jgi:DeoR/GlpR family transcriptional regulator of sugar metabolism
MADLNRQSDILAYLNEYETITVKEICKKFYVSEATARRDLTALEKQGAVRRVFGGATLIYGSDRQIPLFVREREDAQEKMRICKKASEFVHDGSVIFIDGSSTAQFMLNELGRFKDLIVITNGLRIAEKLGQLHIKVYSTGGLLMENSAVLIGDDAERFVENFNADVCFLSCKGVSDSGKLTDTSYFETQLRKRFLKNSKTKVMLITKHKFGKEYIHTLCNVDDVDHIITDD